MIYGIGTDIVSVARFERLLARYGQRVAARVLNEIEIPAYGECAQPAAFLAKRFAAKEAFAKAIGTGIRGPLSLARVRIEHDHAGKPVIRFDAEVAALLAARGVQRCHLSISDEKDMACAFVVLETE